MNQDESMCVDIDNAPLSTLTYPFLTTLSLTSGDCIFRKWTTRDALRRLIDKYSCIPNYKISVELPGGMDCN